MFQFKISDDKLLFCYALTGVGIHIESSAEAVTQSVKFGAEDLYSNITGSSTESRSLKYKRL